MVTKTPIKRRTFLKGLGAAGAANIFHIAPASALGLDGHVAPSNRIVVGAIGIGWQGGNNLGSALGIKEFQVVAVCDIDGAHLEDAKNRVNRKYQNAGCATYGDFRELIARGDLDVASIALPDHWHAVPAIEAANAGLDVFGEKPLSHDLAAGRAMCDAIHRHGCVWQTGSWQRSREEFHRACELVRNGRIGKVHTVEVGLGGNHTDYENTQGQETPMPPPAHLDYETWVGPAPWAPYCPARVHKNWRWVMDHGGGKLMDWVGHHVDIAHWGLDFDSTGPAELEGSGVFPPDGLWDAPTHFQFNCTYANGVNIIVGSDLPGGTKWYGDEGWVHVDRGRLDASGSVLEEVIGPEETKLYYSRDHFQNFADCIKSRKLTITPIETAHRSASVGHLCNIAMATGRKLKWDPKKEKFIGDPGAGKFLTMPYREPWQR